MPRQCSARPRGTGILEIPASIVVHEIVHMIDNENLGRHGANPERLLPGTSVAKTECTAAFIQGKWLNLNDCEAEIFADAYVTEYHGDFDDSFEYAWFYVWNVLTDCHGVFLVVLVAMLIVLTPYITFEALAILIGAEMATLLLWAMAGFLWG